LHFAAASFSQSVRNCRSDNYTCTCTFTSAKDHGAP